MRIELELPEVHFLGLSPQEIAQQVRLLTALMRFGAGEISVGAACELAGISHYAFYEACKKYRVPVLDYDENELDDELSNFTSC
jgi:predicted HTH domain antitoxin